MRLNEGKEIKIDIQKRIDFIETRLLRIEKISVKFTELRFSKLKNRIMELLNESSIDDSRILQEVAILSEKSDISEKSSDVKFI